MQSMSVEVSENSDDRAKFQEGTGSVVGKFIYPLELEVGLDDNDLSGALLPPSGGGDRIQGKYGMRRNFREYDPQMTPRTFTHRWVQLGYLSALALLSDWICFSTASNPEAFERAYPGRTSAGLIDKFLFMNVASCFLVTDIVARYGLQRTVQTSSALMAAGCWFRSGLGIIPVVASMTGMDTSFLDESPFFGIVPYPMFVTGTLMVGAAQPFFQCTPPLLSAQWFASNERATSTAVALNFNQIGIAMAFLVGGEMVTDSVGLRRYLVLITVFCTITMIGTFKQFHNLPPIPPSISELEKFFKGGKEPSFHVSVRTFFSTPGFACPLVAFICSIAITNVVGAFIDDLMERGGVTDRRAKYWAGVGFEVAIVLGGIVLGQFVDRTKAYKRITLICIALSLILVLPLGLTHHQIGKQPILLVVSLLGLGFFVGPIQPINAELAVDVTYPGDETAVESVQQIGGNLVSALLIPLAQRAARVDYQLLPNVPFLESDIRGDVILLMAILFVTYCFFLGFNAVLKRSITDGSSHNGNWGHHLVSTSPESSG